MMDGTQLYEVAKILFPLNRSLTGEGVRQTLKILKEYIPALSMKSVKSLTPCFDWNIPLEWKVENAYIITPSGKKIANFHDNNLHLVGYSYPIEQEMSLDELNKHLYSIPNQPTAIPYVTKYYEKSWGFCLSHNERQSLVPGQYKVVVNTKLFEGHMDYADLYIQGTTQEEILISTYICHPSMANNELSGPLIALGLATWLLQQPSLRYSYRFVFVPETIGSIYYLSQHYKELKEKTIAGFVLTCVGDTYDYSYLPSRRGDTLSDRVALHTLTYTVEHFTRYTFLNKGSDERQYCSPGIDLPVCLMMRSKFGRYPEYHTSLDDLNCISPEGLDGSLRLYKNAILTLEKNHFYKSTVLCEPQLGKRNLYTSDMRFGVTKDSRLLVNFLAYCDGEHDLIDIANILHVGAWKLVDIINSLSQENIIKIDSKRQ